MNEAADAPQDSGKTFDTVYNLAKARGIEIEL
jgi:hypothetical protein